MRLTDSTQKFGRFYDSEFYEKQDSLDSAKVLLAHLWKYIQPASVADIGCARGVWLKACHELGATTLFGFDGEWNNQSIMIDNAIRFTGINLNQPFTVPDRVDLVMSLEVAEHLEKSSASTFVDCLTKASHAVLFSAAYTGQGGTNHINEQPHSYWANLFFAKGYFPFDLFRPVFWDDERVRFWYRQNIFLYVKKTSPTYQKLKSSELAELSNYKFMDCVHPTLYKQKLDLISQASNAGFMQHVRELIPSFSRAVRRRVGK